MATSSMYSTVSSLLLAMFILSFVGSPVSGADPDITTDFGINVTSGADLHYTGFRNLPDQPEGQMHISLGFDTQFPGVRGMGIAPAYLKFGPNSINPFHTHPRANEIIIIIEGELDAGVLDTGNRLYSATLEPGDVFVFPKGLMHFLVNRSKTKPATVVAAFNSENAGRVDLPLSIFNSQPRIETDIIERSLFLDKQTVERLKAFQFPNVAGYGTMNSISVS